MAAELADRRSGVDDESAKGGLKGRINGTGVTIHPFAPSEPVKSPLFPSGWRLLS